MGKSGTLHKIGRDIETLRVNIERTQRRIAFRNADFSIHVPIPAFNEYEAQEYNELCDELELMRDSLMHLETQRRRLLRDETN